MNDTENGTNIQFGSAIPPKKKLSPLLIMAIILGVTLIAGAIATAVYFGIKNAQEQSSIEEPQSVPDESSATKKKTKDDATKTKKTIDDYTWYDLAISINGKIIQLNARADNMDESFFESLCDDYEKRVLEPFNDFGMHFTNTIYKVKCNGAIYFRLETMDYLNDDETVRGRVIDSIQVEVSNDDRIEVKLPGGIKVTSDLDVNDVIKKWGKYTAATGIEDDGSGTYAWKYNKERYVITPRTYVKGENSDVPVTGVHLF